MLRIKINKLISYNYLLIPFTIPFPVSVNSASIILVLLIWLFNKDGAKSFSVKKLMHTPTIFFVGFFCINLIGMLYTSNSSNGLAHLERLLSVLIFPAIFLASNYKNKINVNLSLHFFILGNFLISVIGLSNAILKYASIGNFSESFTNQYFSYNLNVHPTYLTLFFAFSALVSLNFYLKEKNKLYLILFIYFAVVQTFLSARTPFFSFVLVSIVFLVFNYKRLLFPLIFSVILIVTLNHNIRAKYLNILKDLDKLEWRTSTKGDSEAQLRTARLKCVIDTWSNNFLWGVGTGDDSDQLTLCYIQQKSTGFDKTFNAHNTFLQQALKQGLVGLIILSLTLIIPFKSALKNSYWPSIFFLSLFILSSTTESLLSVQKGIIFYSFFINIFATKHISDEKD